MRVPHQRGQGFAALLIAALLFLACLPDTMLVPALRTLTVERFGVSESHAHWFMSVNLVGALLAVPLLALLRHRLASCSVLAVAALANSLLLALMLFAGSYLVTLLLRALEGAADMAVLAVLFDLWSKAGGARHRGRRLGAATTVMMLGLAGGFALGGQVGSSREAVLLGGAGLCAIVAIGATLGAPQIRRALASSTALEEAPRAESIRVPLWTSALMMGTDRMLAGLLTSTVPLMLASRLGWSPDRVGGLLAVPLLLMAFGAWPAGALGDRIGILKLRTIAAILYAAALGALPLISTSAGSGGTFSMLALMFTLGVSASVLMPTAMSLAAQSGRGAVGMGICHTAGNLGYLLGIAGAGWLLLVLGGTTPPREVYALVIALLALMHVVATGVTWIEGHPTPPGMKVGALVG